MLAGNISAFLRVIRFCEGTDRDPDGYRTIFTHKLFNSFADHPRQLECCGSLCSDAAGAYQFLSTTWDDLARFLNLRDFSPQNQDRAAIEYIRRRGALDDVRAGRLVSALDKTSWAWASLPPGRYGQPIKTLAECRRVFRQFGGVEV